jgi:hypothetical protein
VFICVVDIYTQAFVPIRSWARLQVQDIAFVFLRTSTKHPLMTDGEHAQLLANGKARAMGRDFDPMPVVKLFTPDAHATWLLAALDPADGDTAWGLCDVGIGMPELDSVRLSSLASIVGPRDRPVLRDGYFRPTRSLSEYARLAQANGSIVD